MVHVGKLRDNATCTSCGTWQLACDTYNIIFNIGNKKILALVVNTGTS